MTKTTVYGIPNCDSVKKATNWLQQNNIEFEFHDFKKNGITKQKLKEWCIDLGWETVLNKKSTTWRSLTPEEQSGVMNQQTAINCMAEKTSLIKRPVIEYKSTRIIGFDEARYQSFFK
jgi:arsenate reductase